MTSWSASTEREVRKYEEMVVDLLDRIERIRRERDRPRLGLVDGAERPAVRSDAYMDWKVVVCAVCARDHAATVGPELMLDGSDEIVCWACGFELAPEVAAERVCLSRPLPRGCPPGNLRFALHQGPPPDRGGSQSRSASDWTV
jgi:hypothetical protein